MLLKIKSFASHTLTMSTCTEFCNLLNSEKGGERNNKRKLTRDDLKAFKDSQFNRRRDNYFSPLLS